MKPHKGTRLDVLTWDLTKYINRRFRDDERIIDWAFYIESDNLVVVIDYEWNYHSRLMIPINGIYDFDETRMRFDHYMMNYFRELEVLTKEKEKE